MMIFQSNTKGGEMELKSFIRDIPDFPVKGIIFKDVTPVILDPYAFKYAVDKMSEPFDFSKIDKIAGIESRGFIFGIAIANKYNKGFIPIRKKGKLPYKTFEETYTLEYGTATIEMHTDAVSKGENILLVDDLLATGGTMKAATKLIEKSGGNVSGISFLIELDFLNGRKNLENWQISSIIHF